MLSKKSLGRSNEFETIFWLDEAMPFIGKEHIFILNTLLLHRLDDLFRLGLLGAWVICALHDKHRYRDLIDFVEGGTRVEELFLLIGVAYAGMKECQERCPIGRNGLEQGEQIGRRDDGDGAGIEVGSEGDA